MRRAGTNWSCTAMSLLPVPARPLTNQVSMISTSPIGSRKNAPSSGGFGFSGAINAPSCAQLDWSRSRWRTTLRARWRYSRLRPGWRCRWVLRKQAQVNGSGSLAQISALHLDRAMRVEAVRHRVVDRPAGRGAGRRDRHGDSQRGFAVIFETAKFLGPAGFQQLGVADLLDDVREDVAVLLGLFRQRADFRHHGAGALDQFVRRRDAEAADRGRPSSTLEPPLVQRTGARQNRLGLRRDNGKRGWRPGMARGWGSTAGAVGLALICGAGVPARAQDAELKPIPPAECQKFADQVKGAAGFAMTAAEDDFLTDLADGSDGRSCHISGSAADQTYADPAALMAKIAKVFAEWKNDPARAAGGPDGAEAGLTNGDRLATIQVSWEPGPGISCSDKEPLSACHMLPQQKLWNVVVDIVVKGGK